MENVINFKQVNHAIGIDSYIKLDVVDNTIFVNRVEKSQNIPTALICTSHVDAVHFASIMHQGYQKNAELFARAKALIEDQQQNYDWGLITKEELDKNIANILK